jgi:hypothetical protein
MKIAGTIQTGGVCSRCDEQVAVGRVVLFLDETPCPRFICCATPGECEDAAILLKRRERPIDAARTWRLAAAKCIGHNRAARYLAAAERSTS